MARIRTIKPEFFTSEDVVALSPLARLLYIATWLEADREGRLAWKPATLKMRYFPADACDMAAIAGELVAQGLAVPYGDGLAYLPGFVKHQVINNRENPSKLPAPVIDACPTRDDACVTRESGVKAAPSFPFPIPSIPSPSIPPLISGEARPGTWGKMHGEHVTGFCDWVCLPEFVFAEFRRKSGHADKPDGGETYVRGWAQKVREGWSGPVGDNLKFWRARWEESHATKAGKPQPRTAAQIIASMKAEGRIP